MALQKILITGITSGLGRAIAGYMRNGDLHWLPLR